MAKKTQSLKPLKPQMKINPLYNTSAIIKSVGDALKGVDRRANKYKKSY